MKLKFTIKCVVWQNDVELEYCVVLWRGRASYTSDKTYRRKADAERAARATGAEPKALRYH